MKWRAILVVFLTLSLSSLAGGGLLLAEKGSSLLLTPRRYPLGEDYAAKIASPQKIGLALSPFEIKTVDGLTLKAFYVQPTTKGFLGEKRMRTEAALRAQGIKSLAAGKCRGTIFCHHGLNSRKEHMLDVCQRLVAGGFNCVVWDARAHGESQGQFTTYGAKETDDLIRVIDRTKKLFGGKSQTIGPIGLWGYSLGGAVSLQALPQLPDVKAVVAVAPFAELTPIMQQQARSRWHGVLTPLIPVIRWRTWCRAGFDPAQISPLRCVAKTKQPIYLQHGAKDAFIPISNGQQLAAAAGSSRCEHCWIDSANHADVLWKGGEATYTAQVLFLIKHLR